VFDIDVVVYGACRMTGVDKAQLVARQLRVKEIMEEYGITFISPVLEENVKPEHGKLVNHDKDQLRGFWKRDKEIIAKLAHVVFMDQGQHKSFGMERELGFNRYTLWKPTVMLVPAGTPLSVAQFEDDEIFYSVHHAAQEIVNRWGTRYQRWIWRVKMLTRSLPRWLYLQVLAWR